MPSLLTSFGRSARVGGDVTLDEVRWAKANPLILLGWRSFLVSALSLSRRAHSIQKKLLSEGPGGKNPGAPYAKQLTSTARDLLARSRTMGGSLIVKGSGMRGREKGRVPGNMVGSLLAPET
jgi:hypothetical protein